MFLCSVTSIFFSEHFSLLTYNISGLIFPFYKKYLILSKHVEYLVNKAVTKSQMTLMCNWKRGANKSIALFWTAVDAFVLGLEKYSLQSSYNPAER